MQTPAYICEEEKLIKNLEILKYIKDQSGAKILCALKGFAFSGAMPLVNSYLDGATSSGLWESKYAKMHGFSFVHTYSPAFKDEDIDEIIALSEHVVFNSFAQFDKFKAKVLKANKGIGLRVNPELSLSPVEAYSPCSRFSRLGITKANFDFENLEGVEGLHFHALCEENADALEKVLLKFEENFSKAFKNLKWINFGGGHHITRKDYDKEKLISLIKNFKEKYKLDIYLEPGEAIGWETGYLKATILDIVDNEEKTCIVDVSPECHMPDTVLMPYRPAVRGEKEDGKFSYRFGAASCLAGDVVGAAASNPIYKFDKELKIGDEIIFEDQIHYTIVKNTTFNGIKLPDLYMQKKDGSLQIIKKFEFEEYSRRN